ncbi:MAG: T9SS type A sorting domain-containing protein [Saprospiraceae bacterium]
MRQIFTLTFLFLSFNIFSQIDRPAAINLSGVVDWSRELVFTDAFKQSRQWIAHSTAPGSAWDSGVSIPLGADGYPLEIPFDNGIDGPQSIRTLMVWDLEEHYPGGNYRLVAEGTGIIRLWGAASGTFNCPIDTLVSVNPAQGGVALEIDASDLADPVHNIRFIYPDYVDTYQNQTFTTEFLDFVDDFQSIRFMDWLKTNHSPVQSWSERTPANYFTQTVESGTSWEYIVELSNLMKKDPWICVPHLADDNYIFELATQLKNDLDPGLTIYLEYSNELWNGAFQQNHDVANLASQLGYTGQPWELTWKYTAKRSADIFKIFEDVFGGEERLVKIIPTQAANPWLTNQICTYFHDPFYNPNNVSADAIAIAPYFGGNVANEIIDRGRLGTITIPEVLAAMDTNMTGEVFTWMDGNKTVANDYGLDLISYEGGQHLVATGANVNNQDLTDLLIATNRDSGMYDLYCTYFDYWYEQTEGGLFAVFSSHSGPSKWGSWGIKEFMADTLNYKYHAVQNCVLSYNTQPVGTTETGSNNPNFQVFPNPSQDGIFTITHDLNFPTVKVFDLNGKAIKFQMQHYSKEQLGLQLFSKGMYLIQLHDQNENATMKVLVK